jgi:5'-methylthioadenosine phosphorylase
MAEPVGGRTQSGSKAVAVILGSAFDAGLSGLTLKCQEVGTPWGRQPVYHAADVERPAYVIFRHELPHRLLPNQIPYRAQAWALAELGCGALLATSSVGVMVADVPLYHPLVVTDILMPDNRLPDGSACTLFVEPSARQGHLVLDEGLCSRALNRQVSALAKRLGMPVMGEVVFAYVGGPRTKTAAENRYWAKLGAEVNAMTLAPELVLANELEIPSAALVVGHKYSLPDKANPPDERTVAASLYEARCAVEQIIIEFLRHGEAVPFANHLYRFGKCHHDSGRDP